MVWREKDLLQSVAGGRPFFVVACIILVDIPWPNRAKKTGPPKVKLFGTLAPSPHQMHD